MAARFPDIMVVAETDRIADAVEHAVIDSYPYARVIRLAHTDLTDSWSAMVPRTETPLLVLLEWRKGGGELLSHLLSLPAPQLFSLWLLGADELAVREAMMIGVSGCLSLSAESEDLDDKVGAMIKYLEICEFP